jgi:RNA-dependent RNA polymerase
MNLLSKGIKIGDCVFKFVGYSNSQKKSFCVWMVNDAFIQPEEIFNSCGKIDEKSVSKYAARYAQCFTSTIETVNLAESGANIYCNEDIIINGYNFTDGVGVISVKLMEHILKTYKKNKQIQNQISATASAIQFRYQGYKGVLSVLPDLPENIVVFRRSQRKFASNDKWMEVASISHYSIGSLNRQIIILLSTIGVEDVLFKELYTEYIESIHKMCINGESYRIIPTCLCKNAIVRMKNVGYLPSNEPFLNRIHISMAKFSLQYLKLKTKIQVKSSAVLLGISDELKILDYGEVYCKVQDSEFGTFVLTGDVIVTKNPCLYPSDIRKLKAVNEPRLSHYVNVIVFPQKGKRPHFNEISGSDLDGDMYFIYWDKRLIPSYANKLPEEPPEFPSFKEKELDRQITLSDIEADLVEYQVNNIIGTISNFHLVIADSQPEKTSHRVCKQLAQEAAKEVDSAKTGVHGEIPKEAYSLTKVYPDYLASSKKERYYSKSIIGQLFHMLDVDKEISKINKCVIFDDVKISGLVVPNDVMIEARVHYEQYKAEMSRIEDEEDLPEYDLLSGCVLENEKYHKDKDRYIKIDSIALKINNLISHFKDIYANSKSNPKQLAAAYYYISYNAAEYLSFPWLIVCDMLCNIKMS